MKKNTEPQFNLDFYRDQLNLRTMTLSSKCPFVYFDDDDENDEPEQHDLENQSSSVSHATVEEDELVEVDNDSSNEDEDEEYVPRKNSDMTTSSGIDPLRSNKRLKVVCEKETMTDGPLQPIPLRNGRNLKPEHLHAVARISCTAKVSINAARIAFMEAGKFFNQTYELEAKADENNDAGGSGLKRMRQLSSANYAQFENVIASYASIFKFKHIMAIGYEVSAATTLIEKRDKFKAVLLFDFTHRKNLRGEWPALILKVGEVETYLRPLSLTTETRETIADLIVEELNRLAIMKKCTKQDMWCKIDALMSDSVSKNWHVAEIVAERLDSSHIPLTLFCNAHYTLKLDEGNVKVLEKCEKR